MKKIYKSFVLALTTLTFTACGNDWLDREPADGVETSQAITNYSDAVTAYFGMYDGLQGNSDYTSYYAARMFYYGDVRGDDMQATTQGMRSSSCYEMNYTADNAPNMWNIPYNVIRRANRLIQAIDKNQITDGSKEDIGMIYAEAKVVRALVHFDLVRIYGLPYTADEGASLGVPIMTEPLDSDVLPTRNTVAEVYTQVVKDITEAIETGFMETGKNNGYITVWTAKALLSKVYLNMNKNKEALEMAEDVIANSPYTLWKNSEYVAAWSKDNGAHTNEMLFELINESSDDWSDREGIAYLYNEDGYADAIVTKTFSDMLGEDPNDVRNGIILPVRFDPDFAEMFGEARVFINKFPADKSGDMRLNNLPVIRLSEVYLNAAEAAAKIGDHATAANYLNAIVKRANPNAVTIADSDATLARIILERRKELVGEGHRFFDAMRNNETIVRYTNETDKGFHYTLIPESQKFDRTYFRAILPIPVSETDANPNIAKQQNPGY